LEAWLEFGRGPLFRLSFVLMLLGLTRIFIMSIVGMVENYQRNPDKIIPYRDLINKTISWLLPVNRLWKKRPLYSSVSFLFHVGLILVPLFYAGHVQLWKNSVGFAWAAFPQKASDILTWIVIIGGIVLFLTRAGYAPARALSRKQDYVWPLLLTIPFLTGYICTHSLISSGTYDWMMLIHIYSANLIMVMIPFTKIAHCILIPLSQMVTGLSWKFPARSGKKVIDALGYQNRPTWLEDARMRSSQTKNPEKIVASE